MSVRGFELCDYGPDLVEAWTDTGDQVLLAAAHKVDGTWHVYKGAKVRIAEASADTKREAVRLVRQYAAEVVTARGEP